MDKRVLRNLLFQRTDFSQYQKLLQAVIVAGVFALSLFVAYRPTSRLTLLIVVALVGSIAAIVLLRKMVLGVVGVIVACLMIPNFLGSGGFGSTLNPPNLLLVFVIGLWIFDMFVRRRKIEIIRSRTNLPAFIFIGIALLAFLNGQINYHTFATLAPISAQIGGLVIFVLSIGAFLAAANLITELKWLKIFTWLFITIAGVYILGRLIPQVSEFVMQFYQYGSDASVFWIWLVAITSSQALFNNHLAKRWRFLLMTLLATTIYVSLSQAYLWKSGWLPSLIALYVILWIGIPKFRIPGLFLAGFAVLLILLGKLGDVAAGGEDYSIMTRVVAWRIVLELTKINPILGLGMSNYYFYTPLIPILGYYGSFNSHNNYVDIIAQTGVIGLAVYIWFSFEVGRLGWELLSKVPDGFARAYVIGALGGLVGTLVTGMLGDWVIPFVYNVGMNGFRSSLLGWLFLGGLVALENIYRNPSAVKLQV